MKKFITNVPLQVFGNLHQYVYHPVGNRKLGMEDATSFPILTAINGYVQPGERFQVLAVAANSEDGRRNCEELRQEVESLCQKKGISGEIKLISGPENEQVASHMDTFQKLIDLVDEDDELFACITYGTKPMSLAVLMAVQYAYRLKWNASISCIVYGQIDRSASKNPEDWKAFVYDETALIQMGEMIRVLAEQKVSDPKRIIDGILSL